MANNPVNQSVSEGPINVGQQTPDKSKVRKAEEDLTTGLVLGQARDKEDQTAPRSAKQKLGQEHSPAASIDPTLPVETSVANATNEADKKKQFYEVGDNLFLEHVVSLGDSTVDSEAMRIATNIQIGQELFQSAMEEVQSESSTLDKVGDFIDRQLIRAFPIGGYEQLTNRNERKGAELLSAAITMGPEEYSQFIAGYIQELREEGVFVSDNIFAIADGLSELTNSGYDENELINRTFGAIDLLPVLGAPTALRRVSALAGVRKAEEVGEAIVRSGTANVDVVNDLKPKILSGGDTPVPGGAAAARTAENSILREISDNFVRSGSTGRSANSPEAVRAITELRGVIAKAYSTPLVDIVPSLDVTGNLTYKALLGTPKSGRPFRTEAAANRYLSSVKEALPNANVTKVGKDEYLISADGVLDTSRYTDELDVSTDLDPIRDIVAKFAGSKAATENPDLNTLAVMAESALDGVTRTPALKSAVNALNKVPAANKDVISKVFTRLRDGEDSFMRHTYTDTEFKERYKDLHPQGLEATDRELDAFRAAVDISDTAYMLRAHNRMQNYIRNDYYGLDLRGGEKAAGRKVDDLDASDQVFDMTTGGVFSRKDLHPKTAVWELDRVLEGGVRYIANPEKVRALSHSDVLGYNAGGRRINPNANHFVVVGDAENPRVFMSTLTEAQAQKSIDEINEIVRLQTDEAVQANNSWNPDLQTMKDFEEFAESRRLDFTKPPAFKARDGEIRTGEVRDMFSQTWDDYATFNNHRSDDLIMEYGGKEAMNFDPVNAMFKDFGSTAQHYVFNHYTETAINSWIKSAGREGSGWQLGTSLNPRIQFAEAKPLDELGNRKASELQRQRNIILNRMGVVHTEAFKTMKRAGAEVQEFVFDKSGIRLNRDPLKGVTKGMLQIGFQSAFGFMNIGQFFVQGYHGLTIAAISPRAGFRAFATAPATRAILLAPKDSATEAGLIKNLAKFTGDTVDEVAEELRYIRETGRDILQGSLVEDGTGAQWGLSGWKGESFIPSKVRDGMNTMARTGSAALDVGLTPFKEGELFARLTGIKTAVREYREANPGASILTAEAKQWITRREQALTFRMTNANRAFMQEGFGKLPTQWFTYSLRAMENLIIGRDFTVAERARMAAVLMPMFGLTGFGAAKATDYLAERMGIDSASEVHTLLQYGILDTLLEFATGQELDIASRLAPITLFSDVWQGVKGDKAPWEVALGPSGDIIGKMVGAVSETVSELFDGNSVSMTEDAVRMIRQFSGIDNIYKARGIYQNGVYRSRNGRALSEIEMDTGDAVGQLLGFAPREVSEWYAETTWEYRHSRELKDFTTNLKIDFDRAMELWDEGEEERSLRLLDAISHKIVVSGFSTYDQASIRRSLKAERGQRVLQMIRDSYRREQPYRAKRLEETFQ